MSRSSQPFPSALPQVEIRATAFHRWRVHKWLVCLVTPGCAMVRQDRCATFDDAVRTARQWALAHHAGHAQAEQRSDDANAVPAPAWHLPDGFSGSFSLAG